MSAEQSVLVEALRWVRRGASPIPVAYQAKEPIGAEWQKQRIGEAGCAAAFGNGPANIGILWGPPSKDLVDVDCDWLEAVQVADVLLPATAIYGRAGSRRSHRLYRAAGASTRKWQVPAALVPEGRRGVVLELRGEGSQSVVPPSLHPSGELYTWDDERKPVTFEAAALVRRLNLVAAGAVLVAFWRDGVRHELALALSGALLGSGYAADDVGALIEAVGVTAGDPEVRDRIKAVQSSAAAIAAGRPATGIPKLAELTSELCVAALKKWLGLGSAVPLVNGQAAPIAVEDEDQLEVVNVAELVERPINWLWPNRLARGKLNEIAGEQGISKSVLAIEIAAIASRGGTWPLDGARCTATDVLILSCEDDPEDTIRPRLRAAGADLSKIEIIRGIRSSEGKRRVMTLADVEVLGRHLERHPGRFGLFIGDPVGALMAGRDSHKDADVRGLLAPLAELAMRHGLCVLLIAHLNKGIGAQALYRVIGSIAFSAAPRMLYFLSRDPDAPDRLLLLPGKVNLAPAKMAGLSYHLESAELGEGIVAPRIAWHDVPEMRSADEVLNPPKSGRPAHEREEAETWLLGQLEAGPVAVQELRQQAEDELACSWDTVKRAASELGVVGEGEKKARTWRLQQKGNGATVQKSLPKVEKDASNGATPPVTPRCTFAPLHQIEGGNESKSAKVQGAETGEPALLCSQELKGKSAEGYPVLRLREQWTPCTACDRLNAAGYCSHFQRIVPWPEKPNACPHYEPRRPDVPWT